MAAYHGHQQPAFHAGPDAGHQGGGTVGASSAAHPPPLVEAGTVHGGGALAASQQATAMVVDSAPMKAPEQPKEAVPSASEPKGNMLEIQESSEKGAQKIKASHIAIAVVLKVIQFMSALLSFAVRFVMEIIRLNCARIVKKQIQVLFLVVMLWKV